MRSRVFKILILLLISGTGWAQYRLTGIVISQQDSAYIKECVVYLDNDSQSATTDARGRFIFDDVASGAHRLHVVNPLFKYQTAEVRIDARDEFVKIFITPYEETLDEIVVTDIQTSFGFTRMRSVENFGIYEGKKSEVVIPEQLTANLATNNARQVYSRVAGLNIWENDGAGIQLSIGGRGLDPNRTSNFNVRQNGYDISADALGYPESYYTPPVEAVDKIEIVRGAASLQYGTQFGGLINFRMKKPVADKKFELVSRQTVGSFGFYNSFTSASGTVKNLSYYSFFQYKTGNGWRENSDFESYSGFANLNYRLSTTTRLGVEVTHMNYLAQQPGGLSDEMFATDPRQSNRERNWFKVNWNLLALNLDQKISEHSDFNLRLFGLSAYRYSVGFRPNRVATIDDNSERDLIKGNFRNWGAEARYLRRFNISDVQSVLLAGTRYYHGFNHSTQGIGTSGRDANFEYFNPEQFITYDYKFPNRNGSVFLENIFYIGNKFSFTPGLRIEYISTKADGFYGTIYRDLAGNVIDITRQDERRQNDRRFLIGGLGLSYRATPFAEIYANISQNYRSITFSDMRISNPSSVIDPNLRDEKGYSVDLGIRSDQTSLFSYDVSLFYLNYDNRIGEVQFYDENNRVLRKRGNIGQAIIYGLETYGEFDLPGLIDVEQSEWSAVLFGNVAIIKSTYKESEEAGVRGNEVEFVPPLNLKSGVRVGYKRLKASFQYTLVDEQFTDATNATAGGVSAVIGPVPQYSIMDVSASYSFSRFRIEGSINNLSNKMYFTRRATGYPGPGILPSDGRSFYLTIQVRF